VAVNVLDGVKIVVIQRVGHARASSREGARTRAGGGQE
jgi:hypothetical protein